MSPFVLFSFSLCFVCLKCKGNKNQQSDLIGCFCFVFKFFMKCIIISSLFIPHYIDDLCICSSIDRICYILCVRAVPCLSRDHIYVISISLFFRSSVSVDVISQVLFRISLMNTGSQATNNLPV